MTIFSYRTAVLAGPLQPTHQGGRHPESSNEKEKTAVISGGLVKKSEQCSVILQFSL